MEFIDYQFKTRETVSYPKEFGVWYCALGLGEAGEVQGKVKKAIRDNDGEITNERKQAISKELGDVLWYVARLADELNISLDSIARDNLEKLQDRKARNVIKGDGDDR